GTFFPPARQPAPRPPASLPSIFHSASLPSCTLSYRRLCTHVSPHALLHGNPHAAGRPRDDANGVLHITRVQILKFSLSNVLHLRSGHRESLVLAAFLFFIRRDHFAPLFLF